ncbi:MAG: UDP-N-acetylmuramate--L-alanine ligase [Opitutales bacterium]|jgi:UDP-N-acetylmuramate: L-alanyl-gamma-D-glutamyl-meso-diaminopimelate ligase
MRIYFMGVCGTAMGNAALLMRALGHEVMGSDVGAYPPMSDHLRAAGVEILEGWDAARLEKLRPDLVVVGNVASRGHPEVEWLLEKRSQAYVSLPELLRTRLLCDRRNLVVAGTHGKTTTTCMAAVLLKANGGEPGWLVGGVPRDLPDSSHPGRSGGPFVIEGDEYDTAFFDKRSKFIQYLPHVLAVNNCEFDHADIFRDLEDVLRTFSHVLRIVPRDGVVVANGDDANVARLVGPVSWAPVVRVGTGAGNDAVIADFRESAEGSSFTLLWKGREWGRVKWALPGLFNARNAAMAAVSAGLLLDSRDPTRLRLDALAGFQGVQRRQQVLVDRPELTVIEDFGHHPTALDLTLESLRARYPGRRLVACFEPRSNTAARKVMQDGFREALKQADVAFLAPPHRAEKLGEERFDSAGVAAAITAAGKQGFAPASNDALLAELTALVKSDRTPRCVVFFSNGAFGGIIQKFAQSI